MGNWRFLSHTGAPWCSKMGELVGAVYKTNWQQTWFKSTQNHGFLHCMRQSQIMQQGLLWCWSLYQCYNVFSCGSANQLLPWTVQVSRCWTRHFVYWLSHTKKPANSLNNLQTPTKTCTHEPTEHPNYVSTVEENIPKMHQVQVCTCIRQDKQTDWLLTMCGWLSNWRMVRYFIFTIVKLCQRFICGIKNLFVFSIMFCYNHIVFSGHIIVA